MSNVLILNELSLGPTQRAADDREPSSGEPSSGAGEWKG